MKIKIEVCSICRKEKCSGKIYETDDMYGSYSYHVGKLKICESNPDLIKINGKLQYKLISGFGDYSYYNVKEIK
jgi:hypothetical protein